MISSLEHLHLEGIIAGEILLDLVDGQVNEHTSDLRGKIGADHLDDEIVDALSNLSLKMRISLVDCGKNLGSSHEIGLDVLGSSTTLRSTRHTAHRDLRHSHVGLRHSSLGHTASRWRHSHHVVAAHVRLLRHSSHALSTHVLGHTTLIVVVTTLAAHLSRMRLILSVSLMSSVVLSLHLVVLSVLLLMSMDDLHQSGQDMRKVGQVGKLIPLESTGLGGLILLPISLILGLFVLDLTNFLDLVVADVEGLTFEIVVVQVLLSLGGIIWLLEANESEGVSRFTLVKTNLFDLSELRK